MIRIFLNLDKIYQDQIIEIKDKDFFYLKNVMRVKTSDKINIFNGQDGDFLGEIVNTAKKKCQILIKKQIKEQYFPPKISLAFSITFIQSKRVKPSVKFSDTCLRPLLLELLFKKSSKIKGNSERWSGGVPKKVLTKA